MHAVGGMVTSVMLAVLAQSCRQGTRKTSSNGFYYRSVFRGNGLVTCAVLKHLKRTAQEMLRGKALSDRATRNDAEQQATAAHVQKEMKYHQGKATLRSSAVSAVGQRGEKGDRAGSNGSGSEAGRPKEPERNCKREEKLVWVLCSVVRRKSVCTLNV